MTVFIKVIPKWNGYSAPSGESCRILPKSGPKMMLYVYFAGILKKKALSEGHKKLKNQFWPLKNGIGHQN